MRSKLIHKIMGLLSMLCIASCSGNPFFVCTESVPTKGWYASDTIVIPINCNAPHLSAEDFNRPHNIHVGVRTNAAYAYGNLSILVELTRRDKVICRDTLRVTPTEEHTLFQNHPTLDIPNVRLSQFYPYAIRVTHLMRLNPLLGVSDVRVEIE